LIAQVSISAGGDTHALVSADITSLVENSREITMVVLMLAHIAIALLTRARVQNQDMQSLDSHSKADKENT